MMNCVRILIIPKANAGLRRTIPKPNVTTVGMIIIGFIIVPTATIVKHAEITNPCSLANTK
jgi:hypothetical protein